MAMRRRSFNFLALALSGAIKPTSGFSAPSIDWVEFSQGSSGVAGSIGGATRIYADGQIQSFSISNGTKTLEAQSNIPPSLAHEILDHIRTWTDGPAKTGFQGPWSHLEIHLKNRSRDLRRSPYDDPQVGKLWKTAEKALVNVKKE
jgi:hypothetical protein